MNFRSAQFWLPVWFSEFPVDRIERSTNCEYFPTRMRIQAILFRSRENHISDVLHNSFACTEIYFQQQWLIQIDSPQWLIFMTHLKFITGFLTWKQTPEQYETLTVKGDLIISIPRSFEKFSIMWRLWQALVCFIPVQKPLNISDWTKIDQWDGRIEWNMPCFSS